MIYNLHWSVSCRLYEERGMRNPFDTAVDSHRTEFLEFLDSSFDWSKMSDKTTASDVSEQLLF